MSLFFAFFTLTRSSDFSEGSVSFCNVHIKVTEGNSSAGHWYYSEKVITVEVVLVDGVGVNVK